LIGEGQAHGLTSFRRRQRPGLGHAEVLDLGAIGEIHDERRDLLQRFDDPKIIDAEPIHDVDVAGFDQLAHGGRFFHDADDDPLEVAAFPAPPVIRVPL
jgi:hypothetical protein